MENKIVAVCLFVLLGLCFSNEMVQGAFYTGKINSNPVAFTCSTSQAQLRAMGAVNLTNPADKSVVYAGYTQVSSTNQNPILVRYLANGTRSWCNTTIETTGDDSRAYGLLMGNTGQFYAVITSTGTQPGAGLNRLTTKGWLTSYGSGGGAKVSVILRLSWAWGGVTHGTYVIAKKTSDGKTNSFVLNSWTFNTTLAMPMRVSASSWFSPLQANRSPFPNCSGSSPFTWNANFRGNLTAINNISVPPRRDSTGAIVASC